MSIKKTADTPTPSAGVGRPAAATGMPVNEVVLVGRVTAEPVERTLPSGDTVVSVRISVRRPEGEAGPSRADWFDCTAWSARVRRSVRGWRPGDTVRVTGALRRRFIRAGPTPRSLVELRVTGARLVRRRAGPA